MFSPSPFTDYATRLRGEIHQAFPSGNETGGAAWPDSVFEKFAFELFRLQFAHNGPYRKFCEYRRVDPNRLSSWRDIPAISTAAFKECELTSLPAGRRERVFLSSGTTEQKQSRHFHDAESLALYETSLLPWFSQHLLPDSKLAKALEFVILTPPSKEAPHSSLVHMFETIRRELGRSHFEFVGEVSNEGIWQVQLSRTIELLNDVTERNAPVALMGTAFGFVHLLDHCDEMGLRFRLPAGSRILETGGYKGRSRTMPKSTLHSMMSASLGVGPENIVCEYGMSELGSQGYDGVAGQKATARRFQFPPWARAQIISPETGQEVADGGTGLIRILDLANIASVLAVQTEDLGIRRGDGFELLGRAQLAKPRGCSLMSA